MLTNQDLNYLIYFCEKEIKSHEEGSLEQDLDELDSDAEQRLAVDQEVLADLRACRQRLIDMRQNDVKAAFRAALKGNLLPVHELLMRMDKEGLRA